MSESTVQAVNDHLVLICGKSATGKSTSLMDIANPEGVLYLNCEAGKRLPFKSKFKEFTCSDPLQVYEGFQAAETMPGIHTIVVDSITMLMEMFESVYVVGSANTMAQWGAYAQFFKNLMQQHVAKSTKNVIFTGHTVDSLNESEMVLETKSPVKGSLKGTGIEAYFSVIVYSKKVPLKLLKDFKSDLLEITSEDEALGFKYCYQTRLTKDTVNEKIRGPIGMFSTQETYMDNSAKKLLSRLRDYYA